MDVTNL